MSTKQKIIFGVIIAGLIHFSDEVGSVYKPVYGIFAPAFEQLADVSAKQ
jgi:hypothetical protein